MKIKMTKLISKSQNDTFLGLTMHLYWNLFSKKIQTFSCAKIRLSLKALLKSIGKFQFKNSIHNNLSGYIVENGFVAKLFSMLNVDLDSQTVTKSTNR